MPVRPSISLAARRAAESTYAGIVRLVAAAQRSRAPMSRLADRYAMVFLAATIVLAGAAWLWSGDPIRAVAVLVVATPCPLILAVPVAIVSGLSRAAKHGILIKGGQALETLARVRALVIDKTGTLTHGRARIVATKVVADHAGRRAAAARGLARPGFQAHHRRRPSWRKRATRASRSRCPERRRRNAGRRRRRPSWTAVASSSEGCASSAASLRNPALSDLRARPAARRRRGRARDRRPARRRVDPRRRAAGGHRGIAARSPGARRRADRSRHRRPARRGRDGGRGTFPSMPCGRS